MIKRIHQDLPVRGHRPSLRINRYICCHNDHYNHLKALICKYLSIYMYVYFYMKRYAKTLRKTTGQLKETVIWPVHTPLMIRNIGLHLMMQPVWKSRQNMPYWETLQASVFTVLMQMMWTTSVEMEHSRCFVQFTLPFLIWTEDPVSWLFIGNING